MRAARTISWRVWNRLSRFEGDMDENDRRGRASCPGDRRAPAVEVRGLRGREPPARSVSRTRVAERDAEVEGHVLGNREHRAEAIHHGRVERGGHRADAQRVRRHIKFCVAGITELAVPGGTAHANTTHGTSFISSASSLASL